MEKSYHSRLALIASVVALFSLIIVSCAPKTEEPVEFTGEWIGCHSDSDCLESRTVLPARYLRKEVEMTSPVRKATLHICGLGLYETWINGECISKDQVLSPTVSDYHKTVYFNTFDVTTSLRQGANALAVALGNGRYVSMRMSVISGIPVCTHYDVPKLLYQLDVTYADGRSESIVSDSSWKITDNGPVRANNEFDGETYDARLELEA